jgi:hypothetical protein
MGIYSGKCGFFKTHVPIHSAFNDTHSPKVRADHPEGRRAVGASAGCVSCDENAGKIVQGIDCGQQRVRDGLRLNMVVDEVKSKRAISPP